MERNAAETAINHPQSTPGNRTRHLAKSELQPNYFGQLAQLAARSAVITFVKSPIGHWFEPNIGRSFFCPGVSFLLPSSHRSYASKLALYHHQRTPSTCFDMTIKNNRKFPPTPPSLQRPNTPRKNPHSTTQKDKDQGREIRICSQLSFFNQKTKNKHVDLAQLAERPLCKRKARISIILVYKPPKFLPKSPVISYSG